MKKALFITFEGGEGSGKTTQSKILNNLMKSHDIRSIHTREIGGTNLGEKVRELLVFEEKGTSGIVEEMDPLTEMLLITAARSDHIKRIIQPSLNAKIHVICDRFLDSTLAYQGQNLDREIILGMHRKAFGAFLPDITFFMDIEPSIALQRAFLRGDTNKFEKKPLEFHEKVYDKFKHLASQFPERIIPIDARLTKEEITLSIVKIMNKRFGFKIS